VTLFFASAGEMLQNFDQSYTSSARLVRGAITILDIDIKKRRLSMENTQVRRM